MKTLNYLKYFGFFPMMILSVIIYGCVEYGNIKTTEKPYVNQKSVELYVGEGAGDRNQIQLTSSPRDQQFTWTSLNPDVVTVTQTGLVTALAEGFAVVTVSSGDDKIDVNVLVRRWIPLEDLLILGANRIITTRLDRFQIIVTPVPLNASETIIQWTSSDPKAIAVSENGWVVCNDLGNATITAKAGEIEKQVIVQVFLSEKMPKAGWSILGYDPTLIENPPWFRTQNNDGVSYLTNMIDDDLTTIWHSHFYGQGGRAPCYFIIDLGEEVIMTHISMTRGQSNTNGQTGFELLLCVEEDIDDPNDPDTWDWESQGEFAFNRTVTTEQKYSLPDYPMVRYIKMFMDAKHNPNNFNANFADISVYRGVY
jgi:hypothetical protein